MPPVLPCQTVYFVGDSNTLLFNYLTFDAPDYFPQPIVTRSCFIPALSAATIAARGELHGQIVSFLQRDIVLENVGGWRRYRKTRRGQPEMTIFRTVMDPPQDEHNHDNSLAVVIMVGAIDLGYLLRAIGPGSDFAVNDKGFVSSAFPEPELPSIPAKSVTELIRAELAPLGEAVAIFRDMGFPVVYVHSLHPPTADDVRYFHVRHTISSAKVRYKTTVLVNRELERLAIANGGRFLDMWDATTRDGKLDPEMNLDGDHLNRAAAKRSLEALVRDVIAKRGVALEGDNRTFL